MASQTAQKNIKLRSRPAECSFDIPSVDAADQDLSFNCGTPKKLRLSPTQIISKAWSSMEDNCLGFMPDMVEPMSVTSDMLDESFIKGFDDSMMLKSPAMLGEEDTLNKSLVLSPDSRALWRMIHDNCKSIKLPADVKRALDMYAPDNDKEESVDKIKVEKEDDIPGKKIELDPQVSISSSRSSSRSQPSFVLPPYGTAHSLLQPKVDPCPRPTGRLTKKVDAKWAEIKAKLKKESAQMKTATQLETSAPTKATAYTRAAAYTKATSQPVTDAEPKITAQPVTGVQLKTTAQPKTTTQPTSAAQPKINMKTKPTVLPKTVAQSKTTTQSKTIAQPKTTAQPTSAGQPKTNMKSKTTARPQITAQSKTTTLSKQTIAQTMAIVDGKSPAELPTASEHDITPCIIEPKLEPPLYRQMLLDEDMSSLLPGEPTAPPLSGYKKSHDPYLSHSSITSSYAPDPVDPTSTYGTDATKPVSSYSIDLIEQMSSYGPDITEPMPSYGTDVTEPTSTYLPDPISSYSPDVTEPTCTYPPDPTEPMPSYGTDVTEPMPSHGTDVTNPISSYSTDVTKPYEDVSSGLGPGQVMYNDAAAAGAAAAAAAAAAGGGGGGGGLLYSSPRTRYGPLDFTCDMMSDPDSPCLSHCLSGRTAHNIKERARRARMKDACEQLRQLVPGLGSKADKATVLEVGILYIRFLRRFAGPDIEKVFMKEVGSYNNIPLYEAAAASSIAKNQAQEAAQSQADK